MRDRLLAQIERTIEAAAWAVAEQEKRVARQWALVEELERQQHHDLAQEARDVLKLMEDFLERSKQELADAERRRVARLSESKSPQ